MSTVKMVSDLILQRQWDKIGAELALTAAWAVRCCRPPPEKPKAAGVRGRGSKHPGSWGISISPLGFPLCSGGF